MLEQHRDNRLGNKKQMKEQLLEQLLKQLGLLKHLELLDKVGSEWIIHGKQSLVMNGCWMKTELTWVIDMVMYKTK